MYATLPQNICNIHNSAKISRLTCSLFLFSAAYRCEAFSGGNSHLGVHMAGFSQSSKRLPDWSSEALAMAARAKVLSGSKLEQLVVRLQRHSGRHKEACWRFIIQYGIKGRVDHRRWTENEIEEAREELVKKTVEEVAAKLHRTPRAVRNMLRRHGLSVREIRCDRFSLVSLSVALHVRKSEIQFWIKQEWLQATVDIRGGKRSYIITPEALALLYKHHLPKLLARGVPNLALFEAYLQYCYSPKHTVGRQLLDVRRDKKERAAYAATQDNEAPDEEEGDDESDDRYHLDAQIGDRFADADADTYSE
jgi:hypothetical protein